MRFIKLIIKKITEVFIKILFKLDNSLSVSNIFFNLLHDKVKKFLTIILI